MLRFVITCILQAEGFVLSVTQTLTVLLPSIENLMFYGDEGFFFNLFFLFETDHLLAHIGIG